MKVMVLGAGIIGITTAWYLKQAGFDVVVVERQMDVAQETSFANGGQLSVSHAEPWATPHAPMQILPWLLKEDAPLLFRFQWDVDFWRWCLAFVNECRPVKCRENTRHLMNLAVYSQLAISELLAENPIEFNHLKKGIIHYYTRKVFFEQSKSVSDVLNQAGYERQEIANFDELCQLEPAFAHTTKPIVGANYTPQDQSGDARIFCEELAARAKALGVEFLLGSTVQDIEVQGAKVVGVQVQDASGQIQQLKADHVVMCMGAITGKWARKLGVPLTMYPAKGYSASMQVDACLAPTVSLIDDERRVVFSRLGSVLRIAGTAEFAGFDRSLNDVRCQALITRTCEIFPQLLPQKDITFWAGLRPATPNNVPYIGRSGVNNLWINTGHGTLGWTHSCGSAKALAQLMQGAKPTLDFPFMG